MIADERDAVGGDHAEHGFAGGGGGGFVGVEFHLPVWFRQRPDVMVGRVGGDRKLLTAAFQHEDHVTRCVTCRHYRSDAGGHGTPFIKERHLVVQRRDIGGKLLAWGHRPVVMLHRAGDISGVGKYRPVGTLQPADMIWVHVSQNDDIHLIRRNPRSREGGGDAIGRHAGVKQDKFRPGVDERGSEEELGSVGRDKTEIRASKSEMS